MKRAFLIHGWEGNPKNHWFPWLRMELVARGFEVNAPQLPHAANPKVKEWLAFLKDYVGKPDENTYFVGHSLGCIAIARYLAELSGKHTPSASGISPSPTTPPRGPACVADIAAGRLGTPPRAGGEGERKREKTRMEGCVFVAGFSGRINVPEIREFYELPFDPDKAKAHCDKFVMIFSDNDPYVPMEKSLDTAKQLDAKTILERGKGHFTTMDGLTSLPSVLSALLSFAKS